MPIYTVHQIYHTSGAALHGVVYIGFEYSFVVESQWFAGAVLFHS